MAGFAAAKYPMQQRGECGVRPNATNECRASMRESSSFHSPCFCYARTKRENIRVKVKTKMQDRENRSSCLRPAYQLR
jgi:hypothetical protein